ncbi:MAG: hypothetical protein WCP52_02165 [Bacteroidota bacterium]
MEQLPTGEYSFVQYLINKRLYVDHFTLQQILHCNNKVESFRLMKKLEPFIETTEYKNLILFPTEVAVNFWEYYRKFVK